MRIATSSGAVGASSSATAAWTSRLPPTVLLYAGSVVASVVVAAGAPLDARHIFGLFAFALILVALRKWPMTIWAFGLIICVFLGESTRVIVQAGSFSLYL